MASYELTNGTEQDVAVLPQVISDQFKEVDIIKEKITHAKAKADDAKKKSEELRKPGIIGGKREAIKDLQNAARLLADAQEQTVLAQNLFFDYQIKLAKATKWLFELGVNNAANTETIIRQLEIYMEGGSADELDELKQNEINAVIDRLLQQESMQKKQEKMWDQIDAMDVELAEQSGEIQHNKEKNDAQDKLLAAYALKNQEQDAQLAASRKKAEEQDTRLRGIDETNVQQDALIAQGVTKNKEQDCRLSRIDETNAQQDVLIAQCVVKNEEQDDRLNKIDEINAQQDAQIAQSAAKDKEQDSRLGSIDETNAQQDALIAQGESKNEEQDTRLSRIDKANAQQAELIEHQAQAIDNLRLQFEMLNKEKGNKIIMYVTAATSATALILSILHFII